MTFAVINDELFEQENETAQKYITCPVGRKKKKHTTYLYHLLNEKHSGNLSLKLSFCKTKQCEVKILLSSIACSLYKISTHRKRALPLKKWVNSRGLRQPLFVTIVELSFKIQSTIQRHISIVEMKNWELVMNFTDWNAIHLAATNVKEQKNIPKLYLSFIVLSYAEGRMEWDLLNLKAELLITSVMKNFLCLHFFLHECEEKGLLLRVFVYLGLSFV